MGKMHDAFFAANLAGGSGGGGGTSDYSDLTNKPSINSVTLSGNKTGADLGLVNAENGKGLSTNDFTDAYKTKVDNNTTNISNQQEAVSSGGNGYAIINGVRLYLQTTEPIGNDIPEGSIWIGGAVST